MPYIDNVINCFGFGFVEAMLEPHARDFVGHDNISNLFFTNGALYFIGMVVAGYVKFAFKAVLLIS